ncbi:hypothetical protein DR950_31985 [Kitasatospora xanthocidica]|uniref:Uncharacterized protein n=2 Tax=Streptomycetaceae TaxID=2062 RepID=A0A373A583_9ACTN|nr:hypothetical protein DR950_31985 [Kitasatospora xanthocidica]
MAPDGIGVLLRERREATGRSREEQALFLVRLQDGEPFDAGNLKRWEKEKRLPTPRWYQLLAEGYELTVQEIVRAVTASRRWRRATRHADGVDGEEETAVKRRSFLSVAALATGITAVPGIAEARTGINAGLSGSDAGDLAYLDGAFERHRGGYHGRSPVVVLDQMKADLNLLRDVLGRPHPAGIRTDLALTHSPSIMVRALLEMDAATCLCSDGDPTSAVDKAVDVWEKLPPAYRGGLIRTRAEALRQVLPGAAHDRLEEALATP